MFPPQDTNAAQLGRDMAEMMAIQKNASVVNRWGTTLPMPVTNGAALPAFPQLAINIGPFPEPRAIAFGANFLVNDGNTQAGELTPGNNPNASFIYTCVIGIGQMSYTYQFNKLPPYLQCQSLNVMVSRNDNSVFGGVLNVWAEPFIPGNTPKVLQSACYTIGAATGAILLGGPPSFATHVMVTLDPVETDDGLWFLSIPYYNSLQNPNGPATGTWKVPIYQKFGATPAAGAWMPPQVYPIPNNIIAGNVVLARTVTTLQLNVNVHWMQA